MDSYSCGINCDVSGILLSPATAIEVFDSVTFRLHSFVGMAAEDTLGLQRFAVVQSSGCDFARQTQPYGIETLQEVHNTFSPEGNLLEFAMECRKDVAQQTIADQEAIELMAVNRQMMDAVKIPFVLLIDINADQMGHHVGKTMIVIPLNPNHCDSTFRIRQLANVTEKLPVFFLKAAEIQVAENIAQQDQAVKRNRL